MFENSIPRNFSRSHFMFINYETSLASNEILDILENKEFGQIYGILSLNKWIARTANENTFREASIMGISIKEVNQTYYKYRATQIQVKESDYTYINLGKIRNEWIMYPISI